MKKKPIHLDLDGQALCGAKTEKRLGSAAETTCKACRKLGAKGRILRPAPRDPQLAVYGGLAGRGLSFDLLDEARQPAPHHDKAGTP